MNFRWKSTGASIISLLLILITLGCQGTDSQSSQHSNLNPPISPSPNKSAEKPGAPGFVDVPKMANKPAENFDAVFGQPREVTEITDNQAMMPGEYRLYNIAGHPKGLSVRFYRNQAKRFNLLLGTPGKSPKDALMNLFKIDVAALEKVEGEPLSEKWKGRSGGTAYTTAYAKREKPKGDFTMVHAEVQD